MVSYIHIHWGYTWNEFYKTVKAFGLCVAYFFLDTHVHDPIPYTTSLRLLPFHYETYQIPLVLGFFFSFALKWYQNESVFKMGILGLYFNGKSIKELGILWLFSGEATLCGAPWFLYHFFLFLQGIFSGGYQKINTLQKQGLVVYV